MKFLGRLAAVLALSLAAPLAYSDGGALLLHADAGHFTITVFASPQPLTMGLADVSVLVQKRDTGEVLLDPAIQVTANPETDAAASQTVRLARGNAANRLLQAGFLHFAQPGSWRLAMRVQQGNETVHLSTRCIVLRRSSRAPIVWFDVLLPLGVILLFLLHQHLKQTQQTKSA